MHRQARLATAVEDKEGKVNHVSCFNASVCISMERLGLCAWPRNDDRRKVDGWGVAEKLSEQ